MSNERKDQKKVKKVDLFLWKYDDEFTIGFPVDSHGKKPLPDSMISKGPKFLESRGIKVSPNDIELKSGVKRVESLGYGGRNFSTLAPKYLIDFDLFLRSCGNGLQERTQVLTVFSTLLASYFFRRLDKRDYLPCEKPFYVRSPIISCPGNANVITWLEDVVSSLCIDTAEQIEKNEIEYGTIVYTQPSYLPTSPSRGDIMDYAYIQLGRGKKKTFETRFPAQYRDTGVLLNGKFFRGSDIQDFQERNRWASIILYGVKDQYVQVDPIALNPKIIANYAYSERWNTESIFYVVLTFIKWKIASKDRFEEIVDRIRDIEAAISRHNQTRGSYKYYDLRANWLIAQIIALEDFCEFIIEQGVWTRKEGLLCLRTWKAMLLPSGYDFPISSKPIDAPDRIIHPENDCQELFFIALNKMLTEENKVHFISVPPKGTYPAEVDGVQVWGYLRTYRRKDRKDPALLIRERTFKQIVHEIIPIQCEWYDILKALRKKKPQYLHSTPTSRMPGISEQERTLILFVADLKPYLSQDSYNLLLHLHADNVKTRGQTET